MGGSMSIVLAGSTSGTITLQEPAVAGTNTISLPASTGTVVIADGSGNVSITGTASVAGNLSFNSGYGSSAVAYGCRAWVNFNGTSTVAIRASGNVSSITDNGTGDYTLNFTNALVDANYSFSGSASRLNATTSMSYLGPSATTTYTTSALQVLTANDSGALEDALRCSVIVHR
jgi:hypothetical protein